MPGIPKENLRLLREFVHLCEGQPQILQAPELDFFRTWLSKLGANISASSSSSSSTTGGGAAGAAHEHTHSPSGGCCGGHSHGGSKVEEMDDDDEDEDLSSKASSTTAAPPKVESEPESELELDNTGKLEQHDNDEPQSMGDMNVEVTDAMLEQADAKRGEAQGLLGQGQFEQAIPLFTEAIQNNPQSAILYAKRAQCYIKLNKPNAALRDCNRALEINENSQQALKWRGKANWMLGHWESAYKDFCKAQLSDFDEDVAQWCKQVETNSKKVTEHRRKYERKREEKEMEARRERGRKAQEAYAKAQKEEADRRQREKDARGASGAASGHGEFPGGFPGMGNMGGMPGGMGGAGAGGLGGLGAFMQDPDIMAAMQDPEVQKAFSEVGSDPSKLAQYQSNPKVRKVLEKLATKFGGMGGGGPGGMGGGMGGFPGMGGMGGGAEGGAGTSANDLD